MEIKELEALADLHETEDEINLKLVLQIMSGMTITDWSNYISVWFHRFDDIMKYNLRLNNKFGFSYRLMMNPNYCLEFKFANRYNTIGLHEEYHTSLMVQIVSDHSDILLAGCSFAPTNNIEKVVMSGIKDLIICTDIILIRDLIKHMEKEF